MNLALTATGTDPGLGGTETVTLVRRAVELHLNLPKKLVGKHGFTFFSGTMTGGAVTVADALDTSADGFEASLAYNGPLTRQLPIFGSADIAFDRRKCRYELLLGYGVKASFEGDASLETDPEATTTVDGGPEALPHSLHLSDGGSIDAFLSCPDTQGPQACVSFDGTWTAEFATLALCGSTVSVSCKDDTEPVGSAHVGWSLTPTLEKPKKTK